MDRELTTPSITILAQSERGESLLNLLAAAGRKLHLFTRDCDLLYQLSQQPPQLLIIDADSTGIDIQSLLFRAQASCDGQMPMALLLAAQETEIELLVGTSCGLLDCLPANCDMKLLRAKVSFLLGLQKQQSIHSEALRQLEQISHHQRVLLEATADGLLGLDKSGVIRFANAAAGDLLCCRSEQLIGRHFNNLTDPEWYQRSLIAPTSAEAIENRRGSQFSHPAAISLFEEDCYFYRANGRAFPVACRPGLVDGDSDFDSVVLFEDISVRKKEEAHLRQRAERDALTGLANRAVFEEFLEGTLARAARSGKQVGLLYLDLDNFKPINDRLGHQAGDQLLLRVAKLLKESVRAGDLVARLGGDEFVLVLDDVAGQEGCEKVVANISKIFAVPHRIGRATVHCGSSIGVARFPVDGKDPATLLAVADEAMYRQKQANHQAVSDKLTAVA
ncbi:MAG TPA: hypothetical protein DCF45_07645 [Gammaproteobacteria bacterium]|nr:hypothetical protein [Gammaproteobacteria bacterium]